MPQHGDTRDHHYGNEKGERTHVFDPATVQSAQERYCAGCAKWIRTEGVVGELRFMADHGDHAQ